MRISPSTDRQRPVVSHRAIEELLHDDLYGLDHEEAWLLYLNKHSHPIGKEMISKGTLDRTAIDSRTIMRQALLHNAAAIVILHNHPSGTSRPSQHDIFFTNNLPGIGKWIEDNHLGMSMGYLASSGFCRYPLYTLF